MERHVSNHYTLPEAFLDLDEVAAPPPISNPKETSLYRTGSLEHSLSQSGRSSRAQHGSSDDRRWSQILAHDSLERRISRNSQNRHSRSWSYAGHVNEVAVPPPIDRPARIDEKPSNDTLHNPNAKHEKASAFVTQLYTVCYLIFFSMLGTLARLGLQAITIYPGDPTPQSVLWANFAGSMIMGFLSEDRALFREEWGPKRKGKPPGAKRPSVTEETDLERLDSTTRRKRHGAVKKTIPLFIGLATGFCGSFTSFSSWQRDLFLSLSNAAPINAPAPGQSTTPIPRNPGFSFLALLATLIITPTLCLGALQAGAHLALALESTLPSLPFVFTRRFLDPAVVPLSLFAWAGAVIMAILPPDRPGGLSTPPAHATWAQETWRGDAIFALVFAPVGCLARFYISIVLNPRLPSFPLGTFAVNILGTLCLGVFYDLQRVPLPETFAGESRAMCQILQGLEDGFCGCLTTISTWVAELKGLQRWHSYIYGLASALGGLAIMVLVMGMLLWSRGFEVTACGK